MKLSTTFETSPLACAESAGSTLTAQAKAQIGAWYRSGCNAAGAPYRSWNAATIRKHSLRPLLLALPAAVLLSGCATTRVASVPQAERDPLEGFNRTVWSVNRGIDTVVLKPVSTVYRTVIPRPARKGVTGVFQNLTEPWSFVNNMLQLRPKRAFQNLGRFVVNTTVGVGGLGDPATKFGIKPAPEDFGQTLGRWGVGGGAYMVLPLFGPSTLR
ncbi:MAG: MlaA family lipoprotein, partial [Sphingobium sp.]